MIFKNLVRITPTCLNVSIFMIESVIRKNSMVSDMRRDTLIVALPHREWPLVPGKNLLRGIKAAELRNGLVLKISRRGGKSNGSTIVGMREDNTKRTP